MGQGVVCIDSIFSRTVNRSQCKAFTRDSPVARNLWRECKTILHAIKIPFNCDSYYGAILAQDDPNLQHVDEEVKLRATIKQDRTTYSLWTLYTAERKTSGAKPKNELIGATADGWPYNVTAKFQLHVLKTPFFYQVKLKDAIRPGGFTSR